MIDHGVPTDAPDSLVGMLAASRAGEFAATDPTLAELIGGEVTPVSKVLFAQLPAGTPRSGD